MKTRNLSQAHSKVSRTRSRNRSPSKEKAKNRQTRVKKNVKNVDVKNNFSVLVEPAKNIDYDEEMTNWQEDENESDNEVVNVQVTCREEEQAEIRDFLVKTLIDKGSSNCLYIAGVPGVGKTTTTMKTLEGFCYENNTVRSHYINAMRLKKPEDIYDQVFNFLVTDEAKSKKTKAKKVDILEKMDDILESLELFHFFVVDEIDTLLTKSQKVYYTLFDWAYTYHKIAFITIGNTLDFQKKLSNKVASRMGNQMIAFKPYSHRQIFKIAKEIVSNQEIYDESALIFVSKKMANVTSDFRKVMSILERAQKQKGIGKIKDVDINRLWEQAKQGEEEIMEYIPKLGRDIINYLKENGRSADSDRILSALRMEDQGLSRGDFTNAVKDLKSMGLVSYEYGSKNSVQILMIKLTSSAF